MICVLTFVGVGHMFINGYGSWMYRACTYQCESKQVIVRVDYSDVCPPKWAET